MTQTDNTSTVNPEMTWKRIALRSLLPIAATVLVLSTIFIGPLGFAAATIGWWFLQRKF